MGYFYKRNSPLFFIITFVYNPWLILLHLFLCKVMEGRVGLFHYLYYFVERDTVHTIGES